MKKIKFFFSLFLLIRLFCPLVHAQERDFDVWDGTASTSLSGTGTESDPWLIQSAKDLRFLANQVNGNPNINYLEQYIKLTVDIDLDNKNWTPIGKDDSHPFRGVFDGNEHVIKHLKVSNLNYAGLFGYATINTQAMPDIQGEIKNLHIESSTISGKTRAGGFVGYCTCHITNCSFSGTVTGGREYTGGIVGLSGYHAKIESCINTGTVTSAEGSVGGIAGGITSSRAQNANGTLLAEYNSPKMISCMNAGDVSGSVNTGGIVGLVKSGNNGTLGIDISINNNLNCGTVNGEGNIGGICGNNGWTQFTSFTNNYSDKQMCPYLGIKNIDTEGQVKSKLTAEIIGSTLSSSLGENWTYTAGFYPRPNVCNNGDVIATATTPISLSTTDNTQKVTGDFSYNTTNGITSSLENTSIATLNTEDGTITLIEGGDNTLTLSKGNVDRKIPFYIYIANVFIGDPNNNYSGDWETAELWSKGTIPSETQTAEILGNAVLNTLTTVDGLVILQEGNLTINSNGNLKITGQTENNGLLTIEDGGQFYSTSKNIKATVKKTIEHWTNKSGEKNVGGWYFISTPVADQNIAAIYGSNAAIVNAKNDLFRYDEPYYLWVNYRDDQDGHDFGETVFTPGNGYLTAWEVQTEVRFIGKLNTSATIPVSYASGYQPLKGVNLIGNPFPHNISLEAAANTNILQEGFYTINRDGSLNAHLMNESIPPCTGIFVIATSNNTLTIKNTDEISDSGKRTYSGNLIVEVSDGEYEDKAVICRTEGSKLTKINHLNETAPFICIKESGEQLAITSSNDDTESKTLCLKVQKDGTYTLTIKQDGYSYQYLHLIDNLTGTDIDLNQTDSYTFKAGKQDYAARFLLKFKDEQSASSAEESFTFVNNGNLVINTAEANATLQVIDIQGRILTNRIVSGHYEEPVPEEAGLYIIRLIESDNVKIQKITINR